MIRRLIKSVLENPLNALISLAVVAILMDLTGASPLTTLDAVDGKGTWLEGSALLTLYLMIALAFFLLHKESVCVHRVAPT